MAVARMDRPTMVAPVLTKRFMEALIDHVLGEKDRAMMRSYDLGREALRGEVGMLEVAASFAEALGHLLAQTPAVLDPARMRETVADILGESVLPFHMAFRASERERERLREVSDGLLASLVEAHEAERRRIAIDVHDDPIQVMVATHMRLHALAKQEPDPQRKEALEGLRETVARAIERLRRLLFELGPPTLDEQPLATMLRRYLEQMREDWGIDFRLQDSLEQDPPREIRLMLYRNSQEALTNVRKHAGARRVEVVLEQRDGGFLARIGDDGTGFPPTEGEAASAVPHLGLAVMRERAELSGGWFQVRSASGRGTTVEFWIPARRPSVTTGTVP